MAFFDDSLIAQLIHSFGVRIQKGKVSREHGSLVGEMLLKGYRGLPASRRHRGFDLYGGSSGIEGYRLHFAFFFSPFASEFDIHKSDKDRYWSEDRLIS